MGVADLRDKELQSSEFIVEERSTKKVPLELW